MKTISVIILCHNNHGISICIKQILKQLTIYDELIIVNDHSDEDFLNANLSQFLIDERIGLCSVTQKRGNRSYNRNFGAAQSNKDILLFLDGDMVISSGTIEAFRNAHTDKEYVAFLGNAHGMRFSEEHLSLYIGRKDYLNLVQTDEGIQELIHNPALQDWRLWQFMHSELEPYYWIYYYTCICSADRIIFQNLGGFDEALVTWGSEDIDMGYRLGLHGKIGYAANAHAVHLPHKRNLWNEQLFDRDNTKYLLDKHRVWPFEMLLSFDFSAEGYELAQHIYDEIISWNLPILQPQPIKNSLWINVPSELHISDTTVFFNHNLHKSCMPLLGVSLPCCDQRFDIAYVSTNIFSYPMGITARILQECMRTCSKVVLVPSPVEKRTYWENESALATRELYRTYYVASDTMEYNLIPIENGCYQVCSPQIYDMLHVSRSHYPIQISADSRILWHKKYQFMNRQLILINLLPVDTNEICQKLECALDIEFIQKYCFPSKKEQVFSLTENLPASLCNSKYPFLFVIYQSDLLTAASIRQWLRKRQIQDFVISMDGILTDMESLITKS